MRWPESVLDEKRTYATIDLGHRITLHRVTKLGVVGGGQISEAHIAVTGGPALGAKTLELNPKSPLWRQRQGSRVWWSKPPLWEADQTRRWPETGDQREPCR
jgi:hypothetical protein